MQEREEGGVQRARGAVEKRVEGVGKGRGKRRGQSEQGL